MPSKKVVAKIDKPTANSDLMTFLKDNLRFDGGYTYLDTPYEFNSKLYNLELETMSIEGWDAECNGEIHKVYYYDDLQEDDVVVAYFLTERSISFVNVETKVTPLKV